VKRFSLLLLCASLLLVSVGAFAETIVVYDGTSPTTDVDWWTDTDNFSANWSSVDWSIAAGLSKRYQCVLWDEDGNELRTGQAVAAPSTAIPPTSITFTDLPLEVGVRYWVEITAWYTDGGAGGDIQLGSGFSDGAVIGSPPDPFLSLDLSSSPSTLTFSSTETSLSMDLRIAATAIGSIESDRLL
jgi:hypothetical protein